MGSTTARHGEPMADEEGVTEIALGAGWHGYTVSVRCRARAAVAVGGTTTERGQDHEDRPRDRSGYG